MQKITAVGGLCLFIGIATIAAAQTPPTTSASAKAPSTKATSSTTLPPAIDAAFTKAFPTASVKNVSKEKEKGREQYEVESIDHGRGRDLIYLSDGTLVEMEEELTESELPSPVASAIKARYPKATVTKRERLTITKGHVVQYEVGLSGANVKEATLTADGKWVSPK